MSHERFMRQAIELALNGARSEKGGPFGAVIVKDGKVVGKDCNNVTSTNDPTAHAEVSAIRDACRNLNTFQLDHCTIYCSCEPCPMCLGAIYWARIERVYFACGKTDAAQAGFDDKFIYEEFKKTPDKRTIKMTQLLPKEGQEAFEQWAAMEEDGRIDY